MYSGAIALIRSVLVTGAPGEGGISGWGAEDISFQRPSPEETRLTFDGSPQIQARQLTGGALVGAGGRMHLDIKRFQNDPVVRRDVPAALGLIAIVLPLLLPPSSVRTSSPFKKGKAHLLSQ